MKLKETRTKFFVGTRKAFFSGVVMFFPLSFASGDPYEPVLPPLPGLEDVILSPYLGERVSGAVRFEVSPVVTQVSSILISQGDNAVAAFPLEHAFSPLTKGLCYRFLKPGRKDIVAKGTNAMGQHLEQKFSFFVLDSGEKSVFCSSSEGARIFSLSRPSETIWVAPEGSAGNSDNNVDEERGDDGSQGGASHDGNRKGPYFSSYVRRFPSSVMRKEKPLSEENRAIFAELQRIAKQYGVGQGSPFDIARSAGQRIANKRGYGNTPCAEVQSEVLRRVFKKVGAHEEFEGSPLVTTLNTLLARLGWIVWDPNEYYPTPGAVGMHTRGISPSHTYLIGGLPENAEKGIRAAGFDFGEYAFGRYVLDNSSAMGKDIKILTAREVAFQYNTGAFWLPPGIVPAKRRN